MLREALMGAGESLLGLLPGGSSTARQRSALDETEHRPWPLPDSAWVMGQTWLDLLFAHWRVDHDRLRKVVPPQLPIDTFDGSAWLGVTPFVVSALRLRGTLPPPLLSSFCEINVRTYVNVADRPGIYFLSLDAASRAAVLAARRFYRLPYFRSDIEVVSRPGDEVRYSARRISGDGPAAEFRAEYRPVGPPDPAEPGTLAHWLAERYCLYAVDDEQRVVRADIHHAPWPLRSAEIELERNTMGQPFDLELDGDPVVHFSARQDVVLWPLEPVEK
jgi:uncharacterized protein YqjF (DUF2071 family)